MFMHWLILCRTLLSVTKKADATQYPCEALNDEPSPSKTIRRLIEIALTIQRQSKCGDAPSKPLSVELDANALMRICSAADLFAIRVLDSQLNALHRTAAEHVLPLIEKLWSYPTLNKLSINVYSSENLEKNVRLEAAVDARINKVLGRLVALKEFKRTPAGGAPTPALALPQPI
jgi:hypothetical protein